MQTPDETGGLNVIFMLLPYLRVIPELRVPGVLRFIKSNPGLLLPIEICPLIARVRES